MDEISSLLSGAYTFVVHRRIACERARGAARGACTWISRHACSACSRLLSGAWSAARRRAVHIVWALTGKLEQDHCARAQHAPRHQCEQVTAAAHDSRTDGQCSWPGPSAVSQVRLHEAIRPRDRLTAGTRGHSLCTSQLGRTCHGQQLRSHAQRHTSEVHRNSGPRGSDSSTCACSYFA